MPDSSRDPVARLLVRGTECQQGSLEFAWEAIRSRRLTGRRSFGLLAEFTLGVVEFATESGELDESLLASLPSVEAVAREGDAWRLTVREVHRSVPALLEALASRELEPTQLTTHHATLEDVFVSHTGRSLRDA